MERYRVVVKENRVAEVQTLDDDEEEYLGIEWALSEVKDSYRHSKRVDGSYTLAGRDELSEFLAYLGELLGRDALGGAPNANRSDR